MPTPLSEILTELNELLEPDTFKDYAPNGLQVTPSSPTTEHHVEKVITAVSAQAELFEKAAAANAQLVIVHHGLFWGPGFETVEPMLRNRLKLLFDADLALAAYHLPLDAHPRLGNNALIAEALAAERIEPFGRHGERTLGFLAELPGDGLTPVDLARRLASLTAREPLLQPTPVGERPVKRLAIVSGGASEYLEEAALAGADAFLTGEVKEKAMATAAELGLVLIAAGHYATETFGVKALGEHLTERFGLEHVFIDIPNPV